MPQTPRRNSQTTPNWAVDQLSANRYAAGAAVAALVAAYVVAGRGEPQRAPIPPGATLVTGLEALAPPRPKGAAPLGGKWPLDVLLVPGYERPPTCDCQLQLDARERCAADKCEQFHDEQWRRGRARCESLAQAGQCRSNSNHMYKECAEACVKREPCIDLEANCAFWKGLGECVKNAGYMINHCPVSCETCDLRAAPRARCLTRFPDWLHDESSRVDWLVDPEMHASNLTMRLRQNYPGFVALSEDPFVGKVSDFLDGDALAKMKADVLPEVPFKPPAAAFRGVQGRAASSGWCTGTCDQKRSVVHDALDTISQIVGHTDRNASEQAHFLDLAPGQQYGLRDDLCGKSTSASGALGDDAAVLTRSSGHEFVLDQTLTAAGPRIYSAVVFLDDADQGGELWFPDLNIAVPPKAGTLVIYANVKRDDYLAPEPRTRHAHRALADGAPHHVHACVEIKFTVRALEAWVHLFPFREAHTHTCIAPHGQFRSGEYDDEASELRHRRERLLALRRARAAAAADGV